MASSSSGQKTEEAPNVQPQPPHAPQQGQQPTTSTSTQEKTREQEARASNLSSDTQLPDSSGSCRKKKPKTPVCQLPEDDDEDILVPTEREKEILAEDPTYVYPSPVPIPPSRYWSGRLLNDIIVDEIENPNNFYIRNYETNKELKVLEDAMYEYCQANWKVNTILPMNEIIINGFYAVYSYRTGRWHRGKVLSPVGRDDGRRPEELLVFLVDHGKTDIVTLECVAYLRQHHVELPIQAAWASLDVPGIDDVKIWDVGTIGKFKKDVGGKRFSAIIKRIGHCSEKHMTRVKVVLTEKVDGEEKIYNFGGLLSAGLMPKKEKATDG